MYLYMCVGVCRLMLRNMDTHVQVCMCDGAYVHVGLSVVVFGDLKR